MRTTGAVLFLTRGPLQSIRNFAILSLDPWRHTMSEPLPRSISCPMQFKNGSAIGISNRWHKGQYCVILTPAGLVGCGVYDMKTPAEFGQAIAIARGTPAKPLVNPEDLLEAKIVDATPKAKELGIQVGMAGREAVELMLAAKLS